MNAYTELINWLVALLNSDIDINTVTEGSEIDRIDISKKSIYPLAHIDADDVTFNTNLLTFAVSVQVLDQLDYNNEIKTDKLYNNDNRVDVYNTSLQSLRRLFSELKLNKRIVVDGEPSVQKVSDKKNSIIGWQMNLSIQVPNDIMSICQ